MNFNRLTSLEASTSSEPSSQPVITEIETGVENGCNPSPWAPCPNGGVYRREYRIERTYPATGSIPAANACSVPVTSE